MYHRPGSLQAMWAPHFLSFYLKSVHIFPDLNLLTRSESVFAGDFTGAETVGVWRQDVMKQIPT